VAPGSHDVGNDGAKVSGTEDCDFDSLIAHEGLPPEEKDRALERGLLVYQASSASRRFMQRR
jgi:hypothetical protein